MNIVRFKYDLSFGNNLLGFPFFKQIGYGPDLDLYFCPPDASGDDCVFVNSNETLDVFGGEEFATENFNFILGQGVGLFNTTTGWSGNLNTISGPDGYWLNVINVDGLTIHWEYRDKTPANIEYVEFEKNLGDGNNLISIPIDPNFQFEGPNDEGEDKIYLYDYDTGAQLHPYNDECGDGNPSAEDFLTDYFINNGVNVQFLLGQGLGLFNTSTGWSGNLTGFTKGAGYWLNVESSYDFIYNICPLAACKDQNACNYDPTEGVEPCNTFYENDCCEYGYDLTCYVDDDGDYYWDYTQNIGMPAGGCTGTEGIDNPDCYCDCAEYQAENNPEGLYFYDEDDDELEGAEMPGCTDSAACNYDASFTDNCDETPIGTYEEGWNSCCNYGAANLTCYEDTDNDNYWNAKYDLSDDNCMGEEGKLNIGELYWEDRTCYCNCAIFGRTKNGTDTNITMSDEPGLGPEEYVCKDSTACFYDNDLNSVKEICNFESSQAACEANGWSTTEDGRNFFTPEGESVNSVELTENCCCVYPTEKKMFF